ncbi:hypothetical protein VTJ04DRAFT_3356 [Mycothermus thermophilus]|uniref:uncharacterized protein n=1 Tax=Humicola insolens TaxID=85995 RepID=UPI00374322EB
MASRLVTPLRFLRQPVIAAAARGSARPISSTARRLEAIAAPASGGAPLVARKPVGALRGGLFGFFLGSSLAAGGIYYYAIQDYKASNELLTEDIYVRVCI